MNFDDEIFLRHKIPPSSRGKYAQVDGGDKIFRGMNKICERKLEGTNFTKMIKFSRPSKEIHLEMKMKNKIVGKIFF